MENILSDYAGFDALNCINNETAKTESGSRHSGSRPRTNKKCVW